MPPPVPPTFNVKNKVVAITGGAGIGLACAELLLAQGAKVSMADVSDKALKEAEENISKSGYAGTAMFQVVDVRKVDQVDDWISKTVEKFGKLDGAVNMAGVIPKSINIERVEDLNDPDWEFVIDVNLTGGRKQYASTVDCL